MSLKKINEHKSKLNRRLYTQSKLLSVLAHPCIFLLDKSSFSEKLCYLWDAMSCQWSPCFLVLLMLLVSPYSTQWSSGIAPVLLLGHYAMPVVTWWSIASAANLRERLTVRHFLPCSPSCFFQGFPGTGSST